MTSEVRKSVQEELTFTNFIAFVKSDFLDLVKFDFLDLAILVLLNLVKFATVDRFLISAPMSLLPPCVPQFFSLSLGCVL